MAEEADVDEARLLPQRLLNRFGERRGRGWSRPWSGVRVRPEPSWLRRAAGQRLPRAGASHGHRKDPPAPSFLLERRAHGAEVAVWVQASSWGWSEGQRWSGLAPDSGVPKPSPWECDCGWGPRTRGHRPVSRRRAGAVGGLWAGRSTILGSWGPGAGPPSPGGRAVASI